MFWMEVTLAKKTKLLRSTKTHDQAKALNADKISQLATRHTFPKRIPHFSLPQLQTEHHPTLSLIVSHRISLGIWKTFDANLQAKRESFLNEQNKNNKNLPNLVSSFYISYLFKDCLWYTSCVLKNLDKKKNSALSFPFQYSTALGFSFTTLCKKKPRECSRWTKKLFVDRIYAFFWCFCQQKQQIGPETQKKRPIVSIRPDWCFKALWAEA